MKNAVKSVAPAYLLLKPYILKRKVGGFEVASQEDESAPELGEIIQVGKPALKDLVALHKLGMTLAEEAEEYDRQFPWKVGMVIGYKRYNHFKFALGATDQLLVAFENVLFELEVSSE